MNDREHLDVRLRDSRAIGGDASPHAGIGATPGWKSRIRRLAGGVAWLFQSPAEWLGWRAISEGAGAVRRLYRGPREAQRRDRRFKTQDNHRFDLAGTAFAYGISIGELERRLAVRRRQTAFMSYVLFSMACAFVLAWVWVALRTAGGGGRVVLLLQFLPFCALFYLMSFYQALLNFQIRTGRAANWREYLATETGFLPRW